MGPHPLKELRPGHAVGDGHCEFADEIRCPSAHHLDAQQSVRLRVRYNLDEATLLQIDDALAVAAHKVFAGLYSNSLCLASSAVMPTDAISGSV